MSGCEQKFIEEAFDTNWVVPLGPNVDGFEDDLKRFLGCHREVVALSSGTAAIHLALVLLGVGVGDEVICQSFTFCASANPIVYLGATPVFVDSEDATWNISPQLLEAAIEDRLARTGRLPKAIVVVHLYGMPAMMDEILAVASRYDIPIVEDAAEAMGSTYRGRECGTMGHFGVLSFNGNKMITTSGGGALICQTLEERERAIFYATQARECAPYYQHEKIGYNYRLSNICAGIGRGQMTVVEEHIAHHRHIHSLYRDAFEDVEGVELMEAPNSDYTPNYWLSTIVVDKQRYGADYREIIARLQSERIESRPLWKPLHLQPVFSTMPAYVDGTAERLFGRGICLPSGPCVGEADVQRVVDIIENCV